MAAIRSFFKRTHVEQHSSNDTSSISGTASTPSNVIPSSLRAECLNRQNNDADGSSSILGNLTNTNGDSQRHPLLNVPATKHNRKCFLRLIHRSTIAHKEDEPINGNTCLLDLILPKELILRIFSYLDYQSLCRCAQVSRYWNVLALDGSNWQSINLKSFQRDINGLVLENLSMRCGKFLKKLCIENCKFVTDDNMGIVTNHCQNLERLNIKHCDNLSNTSLFYLSKHCPNLKHVNIASCHHMDDQGIKMVSMRCSHLESWDISWCVHITEHGIRILAESCPKLIMFRAEGCINMTNSAAIYLAKNCTKLVFLDLNRCSSLTDEGLTSLAEHCSSLQTLIIANCTSLTDSTLIALGNYCHQLKKIDVTLCSQFTDAGFLAVAQGCHLLQRIDLEDCVAITDETLRHLADNCPNIENITLSRCEQITDGGVRYLGSSVSAQENLRVLELDNCPSITDISISHLLSCQNLQRLDIFDCQQITRHAVKRIQMRHPNLKIHAYFAPRTPTPMAHQTTSCSTCVPSCCTIV